MFAQMSYIGLRGKSVGLDVGASTSGNTRLAGEGMAKLTVFCLLVGGSALEKHELKVECCSSQIYMKRFTLTDALTHSQERLNHLISLA